jgi:hypothetical protein
VENGATSMKIFTILMTRAMQLSFNKPRQSDGFAARCLKR